MTSAVNPQMWMCLNTAAGCSTQQRRHVSSSIWASCILSYNITMNGGGFTDPAEHMSAQHRLSCGTVSVLFLKPFSSKVLPQSVTQLPLTRLKYGLSFLNLCRDSLSHHVKLSFIFVNEHLRAWSRMRGRILYHRGVSNANFKYALVTSIMFTQVISTLIWRYCWRVWWIWRGPFVGTHATNKWERN